MPTTETISAGFLRHRVVLQMPVQARDSMGGTITTWQDLATIWAGIEPLQGKEWFADARDTSEQWTIVTIRYRIGVKPTMRIKFGTTIYDIRAVADIDLRNRKLRLTCREVI
ncbi:MAG TPA: phage head closure protein [Symbiobacteriaceae bacterium]|jgi:SPP1 family predicted phage head-tail adaptor